jgi:hypothetical protein
VALGGVLERGERLADLAARGMNEAAAARHVREHPLAARALRVGLPRAEQ